MKSRNPRAGGSRRAVDRVALADAAQVNAHAPPFQKCRARLLGEGDQVPVVDERQLPQDVVAIRNLGVPVLVVELPQAGERAEGDVELAAGPFADLVCQAQDLAHVGADRNGAIAGGLVHSQHVAAGTPHAHERVETIELAEHRLEGRNRRRFVRRPCSQTKLRPH